MSITSSQGGQKSSRSVVDHTETLVIPGLEDVVVFETITTPGTGNRPDRHEVRYRSLIGRRLIVKTRSDAPNARYQSPHANDTISRGGEVWTHRGETETGSRRAAGRGVDITVYESHGSATAKLSVEVHGDPPYTRIHSTEASIPLT